jgi:sugar/nucleoside kinase (ribokinase family)
MEIFKNRSQDRVGILGIGNALVDILINLPDDSVLEKFGLVKGSMTLVDAGLSATIREATAGFNRQMQTGGSAANTVNGIARLGGLCGYIGKITDDEPGRFFSGELVKLGIGAHLSFSNTGTGLATALISPDSERTFGTYLGAAMELTPEDLNPEVFRKYGIVHIEGYLVQNHQLIERAMQIARAEGLLVSIDMASFNIVEANLDFLKRLIADYVDIVFANEEEARAFTGKSPREALTEIATVCSIAVVKTGAEGSLIQAGDEFVKIKAISANSVDTTGAGDIYAAGFLYGLAQGWSLTKAGKAGSLLAGKVVEVIGAKIPEYQWAGLREEIGTY